jgi:hypothetical protein
MSDLQFSKYLYRPFKVYEMHLTDRSPIWKSSTVISLLKLAFHQNSTASKKITEMWDKKLKGLLLSYF